MRIFNDLNALPKFNNAVVTIGSFDGVHHGHQQILGRVKRLAKKAGGESIVVTFHPHPRLVIYPKDNSLQLITTIDEKIALLERYGIDNVVVVPFTVEFSQQSADEYIQRFLVDKFQPKHIVIGYDHRFGKNRQGDVNYLKWHGTQTGFEVVEIEPQEVSEIAVSSTKIRKALETGQVGKAAEWLEHFFTLTGKVTHGQKIGTDIGFPTANLEVTQKHKLIPPDGIYAVFVNYKNKRYKGMLYIGDRPTIEGHNNRTIEVNIFEFQKDIYNDKVQLEFVDYIRGDMTFDGLKGLQNQLHQDKKDSLRILAEAEAKEQAKIAEKGASVAVVILNFNGKDYLNEFLPFVLETDYPNYQLIVADNGSTDGSIDFLNTNFPQVQVLDLEQNWGFAEGYNKALAQVKADYFVLLNSDVEVTKNWLHPVIDQLEERPEIGAAQPKILAQTRRTHFEYAGAAGGFLDRLGYPFCRGRIMTKVEEDKGQYDRPKQVFWASGAALFIRSELYQKLGGLDADFFAHMEEIDLCWRIKKAGFQIWCFPQSVVYHVGGGTLNYQSPQKTYLNFRNSYFMLLKNEQKRKLTWLIPLRLFMDGLSGVLFFFQGKWKHIWAIVRAHWSVFPLIRHYAEKRKFYKDKIAKISINKMNTAGIYKRSIVWQFYVRGKKYFKDL